MLVTPDAEWLPSGSPDFFAALGDPDPDYDAELFAIKNLGFIRFSVIQQSILEIELHPRNTSLLALLAVQERIQSAPVRLFRIKHFDVDWQSEITSSAERAIKRLSELASPEFIAPAKERYIAEPLDFASLFENDNHPLRPMAQKWRAAFGKFDSTVISFAINHNLLSQLLIVGVRPKAPEPVWRFIGEAHASWLDRHHHFKMIGQKIDHVPDKDYSLWAAEFYKYVANTGQPRFECVTASIQGRPNPYLTRYQRLLLPWRTASEEVLVTVSPVRLSSSAKPDLRGNDSEDRKPARSA